MSKIFCQLIFILFLAFTAAHAQIDTVRVEGGVLIGLSDKNSEVVAYKGIPYAAPPVGQLRWQVPHLVSDWDGVIKADEFGPACMQYPPERGSFYQKEFYPEQEPQSEDCLYLNVWTAATSTDEKRPVMLWIHGGAFSQGSGSLPTFNGQAFAQKGVVLVTINYRLGIFGLFAHPDLSGESRHEASGNYGLLDQVAALRWVQNNIEAFGGDPGNVTVFGQSSGAGNINKLMASPLTEGLFHRAILQSGSAYVFGGTQRLEQAEEKGEAFLKEHRLASVDQLRGWSASKLLSEGKTYAFRPNIDGWILPDEVQLLFERGLQHRMPILAGSTADEGSTLFGPKLDAEMFRKIIRKSHGSEAEDFLSLYPHQTDQQARDSFNRAWADEMAWGAHTLARVHGKTTGCKAYLYYFNRVPPGRGSERYGAYHSSEIAYIFNTLDAVDRPWTGRDRTLADTMLSYWVSFAADGDPNGRGLAQWPPYDSKQRKVLEFGNELSTEVVLQEAILEFYNGRLNTR